MSKMRDDAIKQKTATILSDVKLEMQPLDPFEIANGYNYDYVFVFKVHDENAELTQLQKEFSMRTILQRLAASGLETKMFYSSTRDFVFCKIRASLERLCKEADRIDLKLEFDPSELKKVAEKGYPERGIAPIHISEESKVTHRAPFESIFAKVSCQLYLFF